MPEAVTGCKSVVAYFALIALLVLGVVFAVWFYQNFEGTLLSRQFQNVKHSQGYVEATNSQMRELMTEYAKAETGYHQYRESDPATARAYQGQMAATLDQIRALSGTLDISEVAPDVQTFLATH